MITHSALRRLFAFSMACIGVLQLIFQQLLIGRPAPIFTNTTIVTTLAIASGLALILSSIQLWRGSSMRQLMHATAIFVLAYAGLSNLFVIITQGDYGFALTSFGKAITLGSGLLLFRHDTDSGSGTWRFNLCRICLGLFLLIGGVQHFLFAEFVRFLVPRWIPFDLFWTYTTGVALILTGLSLLSTIKLGLVTQAAGWMVFAWVLVLHIPRGIAEHNANEFTAICEALAVSTLLLSLSRASMAANSTSRQDF